MADNRTLAIVSVVLYAISMVFLIIGFATPNWINGSGFNFGLWKGCANGFGCHKLDLDEQEDFIKATVAFMILALLAAIAAFFGYLIMIVGGALQLAAGIFELLAIIIYGARVTGEKKYDMDVEDLGYSYWLCTVSAIIFLANGSFLIWVARKAGMNTQPKMPWQQYDA